MKPDMKPGVDVRCDKCEFYFPRDSTCRRYPPSPNNPSTYGFPVTHAGVWCGEFKPHLVYQEEQRPRRDMSLAEKLRQARQYLRAANKGAERLAIVAQLAAERNAKLSKEIEELRRLTGLCCDRPEDRMWHAEDNTWWRREDNKWLAADPPPQPPPQIIKPS